MYCDPTIFVTILSLVSSTRVLAQGITTLTYNSDYDNPALSLSQLACSASRLEVKHYNTLGSLPTFPNVSGIFVVTTDDSPQCGACYAVKYENTIINILAVDMARPGIGFAVSERAMNALTGHRAVALNIVDVSFVSVSPSECGLPSD